VPLGVAVAWVVFVGVGALLTLHQPRPVPLLGALDKLPPTFGDWAMDPVAPPQTRDWWPNADQQFHRRYRNAKGQTVDLLIVYFESQRQSREVVSFRAQNLHRASRQQTLDVGGARALTVNVSRETNAQPQAAVFWYELDGAVEAKPTAVKLRTMWHALGRGHTNGALVLLTTRLDPGVTESGPIDDLVGLARMVYTALDACLPGRPAAIAQRAGRL
jgi:EpsI family protein